jgi:hypothetical protein
MSTRLYLRSTSVLIQQIRVPLLIVVTALSSVVVLDSKRQYGSFRILGPVLRISGRTSADSWKTRWFPRHNCPRSPLHSHPRPPRQPPVALRRPPAPPAARWPDTTPGTPPWTPGPMAQS